MKIRTIIYSSAPCKGTGGREPVIGSSGVCAVASTSFAVELSNAPPVTSVFLFVGNRNTKWGGLTLPFDIGGGCNLKVALNLILINATNASGRLTTALPIPNDPALSNGKIYLQYFVVDGGSQSSLGVTTTAGAIMEL